MNYKEMKDRAFDEGLIVKELDIPGYKGRIKGNRIAIHDGIESDAARACVLAEEIGHFHTTVGSINGRTDHDALRQEHIARAYAYELQVGLSGIIRAYRRICRTYQEVAEELGVTVPFLQDALEYYKMKYGTDPVEVDGYTLRFVPELTVTLPPEKPADPLPEKVAQTITPIKAKPVQKPAKKPVRYPKRTFSALDLSLLKHQPEIMRILGLRPEDIPKKPNRYGMPIKRYRKMEEDIA